MTAQFADILTTAEMFMCNVKADAYLKKKNSPYLMDKILSMPSIAYLKEADAALKELAKEIGSCSGEMKRCQKRKLELQDDKPAKRSKIDSGSLTAECSEEDFVEALQEELERSQVALLAIHLLMLPPIPTSFHVVELLEGLNARVLRKAEEMVGRKMNRVDALWWAMLRRDFGLSGDQWSIGIRDVYENYEDVLGD